MRSAFAKACGVLMVLACSAGSGGQFLNPDKFQGPEAVTRVIEAALAGRLDELRRLAGSGIALDAPGDQGVTPLLWSCLKSERKAFATLLQAGANPNRMGPGTRSPIGCAAEHPDPWYLDQALHYGGNPNLVGERGETLIFKSIQCLLPENVSRLAKGGANLNYQAPRGGSPLMEAACLNQYKMAYELLMAGADPKLKDWHGDDVRWCIANTRIDPSSEHFLWRQRFIGLLRSAGMDVPDPR